MSCLVKSSNDNFKLFISSYTNNLIFLPVAGHAATSATPLDEDVVGDDIGERVVGQREPDDLI
jgi:hypothetical protein